MKRSLSIVMCVALAAGACVKEKKKPEAKPAEGEAAAPQKRPQPVVSRTLTPINVDEVKALLPALDGARVTREPQKAQGERVEYALCFDAGEPPALAESVKGALEGKGWASPNVRENKDRWNFAAQQPPFMIVGSLQRGTFPDCDGAKGQTLVSMNVHKRVPRPISPLAPGGIRPGLRPNLQGPKLLPPAPPPAAPVAPPAPAQ